MKAAFLFLIACGASAPPPVKETDLNHGGAMTKVEDGTVAGYVTIVDFWAESCGACVPVHEQVAKGIADQPRTILRKVDVGDGLNELANLYEVTALPHYNVYDTKRRLRFILVGNDCLRAPALAKQLLAE
ncbi:MAG: thioredoxin domain-containing protein [Kofleriaceae bacterium]